MMDILKQFKMFFFPDNGTCPVCGKVIFDKEKYFCSRCDEDLPRYYVAACPTCGRPMEREERCKECVRSGASATDGGIIWLEYTGGARSMIAEMKYKGRRALCRYAGEQLAKVIVDQSWVNGVDLIVPVPLHRNRIEERGYNQSLLIAEGVCTGLRGELNKTIDMVEALQRIIDTPHQVGRSREERFGNLKGAFSISTESNVNGKNILLIDDVITTGTTLRTCADVLREAGAGQIYSACCAGVSSK